MNAAPVVVRVRGELRDDSSDIATPIPRLSWITETETSDWVQARAELELDGAETRTIEGSDSVLVPWPFSPLEAHSRHRIRARVTGTDGIRSEWGEPLELVAAFLAEGEWIAQQVQLDAPELDAQPSRLRHEFPVADGLVRATLFATALGVYQVRINGTAVDDQILKPGWTPYKERLIHESTDVTALLNTGMNAVAVDLAGGWFTERYFLPQPRYGAQPAVAAQLRLQYADGTVETVATDESWRATGCGPIRKSSIYDGEYRDGR